MQMSPLSLLESTYKHLADFTRLTYSGGARRAILAPLAGWLVQHINPCALHLKSGIAFCTSPNVLSNNSFSSKPFLH